MPTASLPMPMNKPIILPLRLLDSLKLLAYIQQPSLRPKIFGIGYGSSTN